MKSRRHEHREQVWIDGRVQVDGRQLNVLLTDLSENGCSLIASEPLRSGLSVLVDAPPVSAPGKVRWSSCGRVGVNFDRTWL